jgi:hypothetical protein
MTRTKPAYRFTAGRVVHSDPSGHAALASAHLDAAHRTHVVDPSRAMLHPLARSTSAATSTVAACKSRIAAQRSHCAWHRPSLSRSITSSTWGARGAMSLRIVVGLGNLA